MKFKKKAQMLKMKITLIKKNPKSIGILLWARKRVGISLQPGRKVA